MFRIYSLSKTKIIIISILLLLFLIIAKFVIFEYYRNKMPPQIEFDSVKWRGEIINKNSSIRFMMENSLLNSHYLNYTKKRPQLIGLLGNADFTIENETVAFRENELHIDTDSLTEQMIKESIEMSIQNVKEVVETSDYYFLGKELNPFKNKYVYLNLEYKNDSLVMISVITDMDYLKNKH